MTTPPRALRATSLIAQDDSDLARLGHGAAQLARRAKAVRHDLSLAACRRADRVAYRAPGN